MKFVILPLANDETASTLNGLLNVKRSLTAIKCFVSKSLESIVGLANLNSEPFIRSSAILAIGSEVLKLIIGAFVNIGGVDLEIILDDDGGDGADVTGSCISNFGIDLSSGNWMLGKLRGAGGI